MKAGMHWLDGQRQRENGERFRSQGLRITQESLSMLLAGTVLEAIFWKRSISVECAKCFEVPRDPAGNGTR